MRILILKRRYKLSDEQKESRLLDRMSCQRCCGLADSASIPDGAAIWTFENRAGADGAHAFFKGLDSQLLNQGFIARRGRIIAPVARMGDKLIHTIGPGPDKLRHDGGLLQPEAADLVQACWN